ncbi:YybH family protein [Flagellimonas sp.]|uniref:YybH family protein n=1 Tax=Flagellimonas sp. TaxID=2058762 RepID=UPI003BB0A324
MKPLTNLIVASFLLISCIPEKKHEEDIVATVEEEKEAIKSTLISMWDAIEKGDVERYATYVHPDFTQFGETDSILRVGKETEVRGVAAWVKDSERIHTEMDEPQVTIKGNVAWITYYWRDQGITNGEPFASRGKSTRIFVKEHGKWLCIHGHYTLL